MLFVCTLCVLNGCPVLCLYFMCAKRMLCVAIILLDSSYIASQYLPTPSTTSRIAVLCVESTEKDSTYNSVLLPLSSTTLSTATRFTLLCVKFTKSHST